MTYGEKIEEMKNTIATLYDDSEWLRDMATVEEKKFWNEFRELAFEVDGPLRGSHYNWTKSSGFNLKY